MRRTKLALLEGQGKGAAYILFRIGHQLFKEIVEFLVDFLPKVVVQIDILVVECRQIGDRLHRIVDQYDRKRRDYIQ